MVLKKYQVPGTVPSGKPPKSEPYRTVPCRTMQWKSAIRGGRRLNSPRPPSLPSWDLALVLRALLTDPFEPLQSVELKFLSMKTLLLTALASIKRAGDLQEFSVDDSCLEFRPADSSATLRPRPGYVPKVPTTPFRDQVVNL